MVAGDMGHMETVALLRQARKAEAPAEVRYLEAAWDGGLAALRLLQEGNGGNRLLASHGPLALCHAAYRGHPAVAAYLLDSGVPVDAAIWEGETALGLSVTANEPALARLLLERGADPLKRDDYHGCAYSRARGHARREIDDLIDEHMCRKHRDELGRK